MNTLKITYSTRAKLRRTGFTLLEVLILAVLLVVVSKYFMPCFSDGAMDRREPVLVSNLANIRMQLEKYKNEHLDEYPCGSRTAPADADVFVERMVSGTTARHEESGDFGPYFDTFPRNPFAEEKDPLVRYGRDPGRGYAHWCFDPITGVIYADDKKFTMDGTAHSLL